MATELKSGAGETSFRSETARSADRFGSSAADGVEHHGRELGEKAAGLIENVSDKAHAVGHAVKDTGVNIKDRAKHAHSAVCTFTKENPTASVLLAFGLGAIIARLIPSK